MTDNNLEVATLGGGCFWCTEAVFKRLKGVISVVPGYAGGNTSNPTYEEVSTGTTGHAEAIQIKFNPKIISYKKILDVFWKTHDPTTLNKQGNDIGTQYRSVIFYHNDNQREVAEISLDEIDNSNLYNSSIVTEITPLTQFYEAEKYHHDFYNQNSKNSYCQLIIDPKINKLMKDFKNDVK